MRYLINVIIYYWIFCIKFYIAMILNNFGKDFYKRAKEIHKKVLTFHALSSCYNGDSILLSALSLSIKNVHDISFQPLNVSAKLLPRLPRKWWYQNRYEIWIRIFFRFSNVFTGQINDINITIIWIHPRSLLSSLTNVI